MENKKTVCIGLSRRNFSKRLDATKLVMSSGCIPVYSGVVSDFYQVEKTVDWRSKGEIRDETDELIKKSDEFWVFGEVSEKLLEQIRLAKRLAKPVKYFEFRAKPVEIEENDIKFEEGFKRK